MYNNAPQLQGCWELVPGPSSAMLGDCVQMEFTASGHLIYGALEGSHWQTMLLHYRVNGSKLFTSQPAGSREEATVFALKPDGSLQLSFAGTEGVFRRIPQLAFEPATSKETI